MIATAATTVTVHLPWTALADIVLCALIFLRIVFFRREGATHRPLAALLAYVIAVASGCEALLMALGVSAPPAITTLVLHGVLLLALLASRGNVLELFRTSQAENRIYRFIRRLP